MRGTAHMSLPREVLVVDDDADLCRLLGAWLEGAGYRVRTVAAAPAALAAVAGQRPALLLCDYRLPGMDGLEMVRRLQEEALQVPVILMSAEAGVPEAVQAVNLGMAAVLTKPLQRGCLLAEVARALRLAAPAPGSGGAVAGQGLIFRSACMSELMDQARLVAGSDVTVFIQGETGTGKERLARCIHALSPRAAQAFIGVNCGAIPEQLLESELFGHEKGAFTGALQRRDGLFQAAEGGTLFLDEIADMPLALQVKLLRVLQDMEVRPVGANRGRPVDVRVLSATHGDLDEAVREGRFRADLYYRMNVVPLSLPPLRARPEDIPLLLEHYLARVAERRGLPPKRFAPEAVEYFMGAPWPGNVRQLVNAVEFCVALTPGERIPLGMAQRALRNQPGRLQTLQEAREHCDRRYLAAVLRMTDGQVAHAARIAGRNRTEFYRLLHEHGLEPARFRAGGTALSAQRTRGERA